MTLLASDRLEAFIAVAAEASFTKGAARVGITQSAISQRISKLEEDVGATLFVRSRDAARLTAEGEIVMRYARAREGLEAEMLAGLTSAPAAHGELRGVLRIAGFSSMTRSIVMPALTPLITASPELTVHTFSRELGELPQLLRSGEADLIVLDRDLPEPGLTSIPLGMERNVLVESTHVPARSHCYLDHDPDDTTTERFFRLNGLDFDPKLRTFLDDIYGILDGVALGWGHAIVSSHLIDQFDNVREVSGYEPLMTPVRLVMRKSRFQSRLHREVVEALREGCPVLLGTS